MDLKRPSVATLLALGACLLLGGSDAFPRAQVEEPKTRIDHIIWAVPDLDAGAAYFEEVSGVTPEGVLIRWSHVDFIGHDFGQFLPFAINWLDSPHPSTTSPQGASIEGIAVEHPRADELRRIYEALGVPAEVVAADEPVIIVHMRSSKGSFEVRSGKSLLEYYRARSNSNIQ